MPELNTPSTDAVTELPREAEAPPRAKFRTQLGTFLAITVPLVGLVAAPFLLWGWGFSWVDLGLMTGMIFVSGLGITIGYHRLITHQAFETNGVVKAILVIFGSMAVEGSILKWAAIHRRHHQYSDEKDDPHTPHHQGGRGLIGLIRAAWYSHIAWFFNPDPPHLMRYVPDLQKSRILRVADVLFPLWIILGLMIPAVLGGLISWTWAGAVTGLVWGGLVRLLIVHHGTWSINSACHMWGSRTYRSGDQSRDNFLFGVIAMGEGWHNSHHAFPTSARHGLRWWQLDLSYWIIRGLALFGLAWNVRVPSKAAQRRERRVQPDNAGVSWPSVSIPLHSPNESIK